MEGLRLALFVHTCIRSWNTRTYDSGPPVCAARAQGKDHTTNVGYSLTELDSTMV